MKLKLKLIASVFIIAAWSNVLLAQIEGPFDFPIYQNQASGRQVGGQHAPAGTPALPPEAALERFDVPEGFEVRLFASEPAVVNPVAMTWDERGRLWVLELYEYPLGAEEGERGRDRIKILEDTDADGLADKVHVWADDLSLATGLILGDGGAYVGQAPHLLHLKDTDGDDRADTREIVMTGFGMEDRHELLNGFIWGPDGYLYMTHGVFTHSKVKDPNDPNDDGVVMNAAVARFKPSTKKFEVFADGTSNPWGVDFDARGNAFVSACVIDHLFHLAPGGLYVRQAGRPAFPYAYELLPSIVDHRHHMAAYCGIQVYLGDQYPEEYNGKIMMGNIHDNSVHADLLTPSGSSFKASKWKDFVRANDGWFRPTTQLVGPDGALWISDWYDKYPCYQNARADPAGVDREYGRVWRVVYTGEDKGRPVASRPQRDMDLKALSTQRLVEMLAHPNIWHRKTAQRLLGERGQDAFGGEELHPSNSLHAMLESGPNSIARLTALWTLHTTGLLRDDVLETAAKDKDPAIRSWAARLIGERGYALPGTMEALERLALDKDPGVRLAVATAARQFVSGSLTVNTPPAIPVNEAVTGRVLAELFKNFGDGSDRTFNFVYWMALEPLVEMDPVHVLKYYEMDVTKRQAPFAGIILEKIMRRVCDLGDNALLDRCAAVLNELTDDDATLIQAALKGLIEQQKGRALVPGEACDRWIARLVRHSDSDVRERAQELGAIWGNASAIQANFDMALDSDAPLDARVRAIAAVRSIKSDAAQQTLLKVLSQRPPVELGLAAIQGLGEIGGDSTASHFVDRWESFRPAERREAVNVLVTRNRWASSLLSAVEKNQIPRGDISASAVRALTRSNADYGMLAKRAAKLFGKVRDADADKLKLIAEKRKVVLEGEPNLERGRELAQTVCLVCHQLHGEGAEIGPDLTGVGRSTLDALLANVIDPNQIIGQGYENVTVEMKDDRELSGRLVQETDAWIKLINQGPTEYVIDKNEIKLRHVSDMSLMPEGLEQLPDSDFRDLIWYILAPPEEGKLTEERRRELIGIQSGSIDAEQPTDGESIALWNPRWRIHAPEFEGTPKKHPEFAGRKNVLETHPYSNNKPSAIEREFKVPDKGARLNVEVAAHPRGDWELRVLAEGELLKRQVITRNGEVWKTVTADLSKFAGKNITLRLENAANNWSWEFGYWGWIEIE